MNLNDMIANAVLGGGPDVPEDVRTVHEDREALPAVDLGEAEKIASALEFLGRRGVDSFLVKESMHGPSAAAPPPGTNMGQSHKEHVQKQTGPHAGAPPMQEPGYGQIPNNENDKPGGGGSVDTSAEGKGDHHPALASNDAAINYKKSEQSKKMSPALKKLLDTTPYADPKLKENLSGAGGKGDRNIHTKTASADHDLGAVRQELARRVAEGS
jgi:hypothetical protein